jgi:hypothetical protein
MRFLGFIGILLSFICILLIFVIQCSIDKNTTVNDNTVDLSELNNVDLSELDSVYLSELDSVDCVLWWEIQNDTLKIWTEEDERRADIERYNYIRSLDTTGWE